MDHSAEMRSSGSFSASPRPGILPQRSPGGLARSGTVVRILRMVEMKDGHASRSAAEPQQLRPLEARHHEAACPGRVTEKSAIGWVAAAPRFAESRI